VWATLRRLGGCKASDRTSIAAHAQRTPETIDRAGVYWRKTGVTAVEGAPLALPERLRGVSSGPPQLACRGAFAWRLAGRTRPDLAGGPVNVRGSRSGTPAGCTSRRDPRLLRRSVTLGQNCSVNLMRSCIGHGGLTHRRQAFELALRCVEDVRPITFSTTRTNLHLLTGQTRRHCWHHKVRRGRMLSCVNDSVACEGPPRCQWGPSSCRTVPVREHQSRAA